MSSRPSSRAERRPARPGAPRGPAAVLALLLAGSGGCSEAPAPPPYGFEVRPEQAFVLEGRERLWIGESRVDVERLAEFRVRAEPRPDGGVNLDALLGRYYLAVTGGPDGGSELAISPNGIVSRGEPHGEVELGPGAELLTGTTLEKALARPISSVSLRATGGRRGAVWHTEEPTLNHARVLEWWALALPVLARGRSSWTGEREVPELGQYKLGLLIPLTYTRHGPPREGVPWKVQASGLVTRNRLRLRPGFEGGLWLDYRANVTLRGDTSLERATLRLEMRFESSDGERVRSEQRLSIRCAGCPAVGADEPQIN